MMEFNFAAFGCCCFESACSTFSSIDFTCVIALCITVLWRSSRFGLLARIEIRLVRRAEYLSKSSGHLPSRCKRFISCIAAAAAESSIIALDRKISSLAASAASFACFAASLDRCTPISVHTKPAMETSTPKTLLILPQVDRGSGDWAGIDCSSWQATMLPRLTCAGY